jgi:hypothetical protein
MSSIPDANTVYEGVHFSIQDSQREDKEERYSVVNCQHSGADR